MGQGIYLYRYSLLSYLNQIEAGMTFYMQGGAKSADFIELLFLRLYFMEKSLKSYNSNNYYVNKQIMKHSNDKKSDE